MREVVFHLHEEVLALHMKRDLFVDAFTHASAVSLTSPQASDSRLQPAGLARLVLARILVDHCQVLIPVAPVHLVHPETTRRHRDETLWSAAEGRSHFT